MMRRDPELRDACRGGDLVLADGMSVVWALRGRAPRAGAGDRRAT
jgi:UDP-N-acetyl-D-mannosaminuronic acid transferase (WecB/TagA/CpsF family)